MARSDLILTLVRAGATGDVLKARAAAEELAADERAKRHGAFADRISRALEIAPPRSGFSSKFAASARAEDASGALARREPRKSLGEVYLSKIALQFCEELIEEQRGADLLRAHGLEPRHRLLLVGPPGNGKTSLAEAIAFELALPLLTVRYDAVVTSYLGETAQRLRRLFDAVRTEPCVIFFDEFDAIGKERGDLHETGEIKRVVTTLLLQLDELPSYCVLIGATNHPELLDRAAWRRFQLRIAINAPNAEQLQKYFADQLRGLRGPSGYTAARLASLVSAKSFSEAEEFFLDVQRRLTLTQGKVSLRSIVDDRVRAWRHRTSTSELESAGTADSPST